jgi:ribosomal-protein-alanine N-acetyltransferase
MQVIIGEPGPGDEHDFLAAVLASREQHASWVNPPDTPERFTAYLARAGREEQASFLIRHAGCGGLIGYVNINNIVRGAFQSGALGYAGFASHAGQGLMTAGVGAVITRAFSELGLHRLEANIQPDNAPSLALVGRLGFRREGMSPHFLLIDGQWRDHERWAMLAERWRGSPPGGQPVSPSAGAQHEQRAGSGDRPGRARRRRNASGPGPGRE